MLWTDKYKPCSFNEIACQYDAKVKLRQFILEFSKQSKKAVLVYGPTGSGKTSCIYALAIQHKLEIVELNASDFRNKQQIHEIIGQASQQQSLFNKGKIILIDELEGIDGNKDRGGIQELVKLLEYSSWPIILVANDAWQEKLRPLRSKSLLVEFKKPEKETLINMLSRIATKEKININPEALDAITTFNECDIRACINDLQILSMLKKKIIKDDIVKLRYDDIRERDETIFQALKLVFKSKSGTLNAFDNVQNLDQDDFFVWIDENLPKEYKGQELAKAYDVLSQADVFRGRIRRWQYWRYLVYVMALLTEGISGAKKTNNEEFTSYKPPSRFLKMWLVKQKIAKKKTITEKIAKQTHCPKRVAQKEFPLWEMILENRKVQEELRLEPEEVEFLKR